MRDKKPLSLFADSKEALAFLLATEKMPFMILSDIKIQGMNGLELRKIISENPVLKEKSIPFIFLTTSTSPPAVKQAYALSVQGFFEKPHPMADMKELIKEIYHYWARRKHLNN